MEEMEGISMKKKEKREVWWRWMEEKWWNAARPIFRMRARMDDAVHVKVQGVELVTVRVRLRYVHWQSLTPQLASLQPDVR